TAAALYGSRASNGAILVTTKTGAVNKNGAIGLEINSNFVAENLLYKKFDDYQYEYGIGDAPTGQLQGQKPVAPNAGPISRPTVMEQNLMELLWFNLME